MALTGIEQLREQAFATIRRTQDALERAADVRLHETLARLRTLGPEAGPQGLLDAALDAAMHVALAPMGSLHLADETGCLALAAHFGFDRPFIEQFASVATTSCACGWAFRHRQRIVVPDISRSPLFYGEGELDCALQSGVRAVHATPLVDLRSRVIGVLSVHFRNPHTPSPGDLSRMDTLALVVANRVRRDARPACS